MFNLIGNESLNSMRMNMELLSEQVESMNYSMAHGYKKKVTTFHETIDCMQKFSSIDFSTSAALRTHQDLDFAIQGDGFFEVLMPDGTVAYTRDGSFKVSPEGKLVTSQGYEVLSSGKQDVGKSSGDKYSLGLTSSSIRVPAGTMVTLDKNGIFRDQDHNDLGKISLVTFNNLDGLKEIHNGFYQPTLAAGDLHDVPMGDMIGETKVMQGFLESSNVSVSDAMSRMQQLNSAIKTEMKIFKTLDQMQGDLNSTISRNI